MSPTAPGSLSQDILSEIALPMPGQPVQAPPLTVVTSEEGPSRQIQAAKDIFGPGSNLGNRYVNDYAAISQYSASLKGLRQRVVYTLGVWDLIHIGHCRYFEKAKSHGDILIVGVELDQAIRIRKGPKRPVIPFKERVEMLSHIRHVDLIVPVCDFDDRGLSGMGLIESIRPDVFVTSERSFKEADDTAEWLNRARLLCGEVLTLHSQAETSTSAKLRSLTLDLGQLARESIRETKQAMDVAFAALQKRIDDAIDKA